MDRLMAYLAQRHHVALSFVAEGSVVDVMEVQFRGGKLLQAAKAGALILQEQGPLRLPLAALEILLVLRPPVSAFLSHNRIRAIKKPHTANGHATPRSAVRGL